MGPMKKATILGVGFAGFLFVVPRMISAGPVFECPPEGTDLTWETFAVPFFETWCTEPCHVHAWQDSYTDTYPRRDSILGLVVSGGMPRDPAPAPPQTEIDKLEEWVTCGAPAECPPGGTDLTWETFAQPWFQEYCNGCHTWEASYSLTYEIRDVMLQLVLDTEMPQFGSVPPDDLEKFAEWMLCDSPAGGSPCAYGFTEAEQVFAAYCTQCHSVNLSGAARQGAPEGMNWDDYASVLANASGIRDVLLPPQRMRGDDPFSAPRMPPHDTAVPEPELDLMIDWLACGAPQLSGGASYARGDANDDGQEDLSDAVFILASIFTGGDPVLCRDAADTNTDGFIDLADAVYLLSFIFQSKAPPLPPFPLCGTGPLLGCDTYVSCD